LGRRTSETALNAERRKMPNDADWRTLVMRGGCASPDRAAAPSLFPFALSIRSFHSPFRFVFSIRFFPFAVSVC
jgi:hypothetical protein